MQYLNCYLGQLINLKHILNNYLGLLILNYRTPLGETGCFGNPYFFGLVA